MDTLGKLRATVVAKFMTPTIGGKKLDLHWLFVEVTSRGGTEKRHSTISMSEQQHEKFLRLVRVDALLFTSTAAVVVITLLSTLARRSRNPIVKALITLIVKKTSGKKVKIYMSYQNIDRGDGFNPINHLADAGWLGFLFIGYQNDALQDDYHTIYTDLLLPATIVLVINVSNVLLTSLAKTLANQSFAVGRNANLVARYMVKIQEQNEKELGYNIAELPEQNEQELGDMAEPREQKEQELEYMDGLPEKNELEIVAEIEQSLSRFMSDYPCLITPTWSWVKTSSRERLLNRATD